MGKGQKRWFSPGAIIDQYFLDEKNPYSKRRPIKTKTLAWTLSGLVILFVLGVFLLGGDTEKKDHTTARPDFSVHANERVSPTNQGIALGESGQDGKKRGLFAGFSGISLGSGGPAGGMSGRNRSANQVIRRGANGNDPGAQLSLGQGIPVRLLNAIRSSDSASPVIAEVTEDIYAHGILSIPASTRAIGAAHYDESSRRIQLRFQTFVYPDGDQHNVQAIGMMPDGSAGLDGDYQSGETKRQIGRLIGHFVSGMADGMKERQSGGQFGMAYEPGSLKNGLLGGVALSAEDQAKSFSDDLGRTKPFMTLPAGQTFILFLEREYVP